MPTLDSPTPQEDGDNGDLCFDLEIDGAAVPVRVMRTALQAKYGIDDAPGAALSIFEANRESIEASVRGEKAKAGPGPFTKDHPLMVVHLPL